MSKLKKFNNRLFLPICLTIIFVFGGYEVYQDYLHGKETKMEEEKIIERPKPQLLIGEEWLGKPPVFEVWKVDFDSRQSSGDVATRSTKLDTFSNDDTAKNFIADRLPKENFYVGWDSKVYPRYELRKVEVK